jgi:hypothetical protein
MHRDRNHGTWPELKAKRHDKFDNPKFNDAPLDSLNVMHSHIDGESHDIQKVKKDRVAKQLSRVQNMFKDMSDYADKNSEIDSIERG